MSHPPHNFARTSLCFSNHLLRRRILNQNSLIKKMKQFIFDDFISMLVELLLDFELFYFQASHLAATFVHPMSGRIYPLISHTRPRNVRIMITLASFDTQERIKNTGCGRDWYKPAGNWLLICLAVARCYRLLQFFVLLLFAFVQWSSLQNR